MLSFVSCMVGKALLPYLYGFGKPKKYSTTPNTESVYYYVCKLTVPVRGVGANLWDFPIRSFHVYTFTYFFGWLTILNFSVLILKLCQILGKELESEVVQMLKQYYLF